eukprot:3130482-Heterocapsa_arctica.AAC.1
MSIGVGCRTATCIGSARSKRSHTARIRKRTSPHEEGLPLKGGGRATLLRSRSRAPQSSGWACSPAGSGRAMAASKPCTSMTTVKMPSPSSSS